MDRIPFGDEEKKFLWPFIRKLLSEIEVWGDIKQIRSTHISLIISRLLED